MTVTAYHRPASLAEALALLEEGGPEMLVMAGGTVAMPLINDGISLPEAVMGLRSAGLDTLEEAPGELRIGATVTLTQLLERSPVPMLREAAAATASWSVRNLATVGGNLFTPPPGGDIGVALLALDAQVDIAAMDRQRTMPIEAFWTGFMTTALGEDELVTRIRVPLPVGRTAYIKLGRKQANTPAVVTVAVHLREEAGRVSEARIALGAAGPHPIRAREAERALTGSSLEAGSSPEGGSSLEAGSTLEAAAIAEAAAAAARECEPFTDGVASEWYRRRMVELFTRRALERLAGRGANGDAGRAAEGGR